jgi:hypothetical protein
MTLRRTAAGLVLLVLAGCGMPGAATSGGATPGGSSPGGATPGGTAGAGPVRLLRTGGFAGVRDTLVVQPDGRWQRTRRAAAADAGQLTESQQGQLRRLAGDPRLVAEAARTPPPTKCRDTFAYSVTVAGRTVEWVDCPTDPDQPAVTVALVRLLAGATAL